MCQSIMFKDAEIDRIADLAALVGVSAIDWMPYVLEENRDTTEDSCLCSIGLEETLKRVGIVGKWDVGFFSVEVDMTLEEAKAAIARIPPEDKPATN